jgi:hypothetical protein
VTVACGGGASSPKSTAPAIVAYTSGLIAEALQLVESPWLIPVIPLLTLPSINLSSFCASDPPSQPTFTLSEANALLQFNIGTTDWNSGVTKIQNLIENASWYLFCQCTGATTPSAPIAPSSPSGLAVPTYATSPGVQPCDSFIFTATSSFGGSITVGSHVLGGIVPKSFLYTCKNVPHDGTGANANYSFKQQNGTTVLRTDVVATTPNSTNVLQVPAASGVNNIIFLFDATSGTGGTLVTGTKIDSFCTDTGLPTGTTTCPPDPTILALLEQVLSLVTIIQRQSVPFAYIPGTVHGPLSGSGEITFSDIVLGLKIVVSNIDSTVGIDTGDPDRLFDVGFVSVGDADGFWCNQRVVTQNQLYFPKFAGSATRLGWTLTSNAQLTITELLRER